jgi:glycosyltransferase involved in cell wall biosynthesis
MSRDTLLIVTTSYPEHGDGSEAAGAFVSDLAEELATRMPVRVVAPGRHVGAVEERNGVAVRRFAGAGRPLSLLSPTRPADWPAIVGTLRSMRAEVLASDTDGRVVHTLALWALPSGWAASALQRAHGVPYSIWALGSDIWSLGRLPVVKSLLRRVIRKATHCYADGLQLCEDAADIGGRHFDFLPSTRRLSPPAKMRRNDGPARLLFLGRWHPNKGVDLLLEALALLPEDAWQRIGEIRLAGGGPLETLVTDRVTRLQAVGRPIRLDGYLDQRQAAEAIGEANWLVIPSRIESIPVVFSDAMKLGCPVIAAPVGDFPGLFDAAWVGILAASTAPVDLAAAIGVALAKDPSIFEAGLRAMAERFDLKTGVRDVLLRAFAPPAQAATAGDSP